MTVEQQDPANPENIPAGIKDASAEIISDAVGGVQGDTPDDVAMDRKVQVIVPGAPEGEPAPDAAEIEWAGGFLRKPPTPIR